MCMSVCELSYILQMDHMYYHGTQHGGYVSTPGYYLDMYVFDVCGGGGSYIYYVSILLLYYLLLLKYQCLNTNTEHII